MWIGPRSVYPSWPGLHALSFTRWAFLVRNLFSMRSLYTLFHYHMLDLWFSLTVTMGIC